MKRGVTRTVPSRSSIGDLGGLAREYPDSNQSMRQTAYAALQPLVMVSLTNDSYPLAFKDLASPPFSFHVQGNLFGND